MKILKMQLANLFTLANMVLGLIAITEAVKGDFNSSALFICAAVVFDILDGWIARKLKITSEFGKYFDSNSDLISFGLAPGLLIYLSVLKQFELIGICVSFLYVIGGAFRLARYNMNVFNGKYVGLPITIAGLIIALSVFVISRLPSMAYLFIVIILFYLMVSKHSFKKY
jgi:CDP-diacylglycerol--serine O-phosphatidyltransferase